MNRTEGDIYAKISRNKKRITQKCSMILSINAVCKYLLHVGQGIEEWTK